MANLIRRYRTTGPTTTQLGFLVNGVVAVSTSKGHAYVDVTYDDAVAAVSTLDNAMLSKGWAYFEADPPSNVARTVEQAVADSLSEDTLVGAAFETVLFLEVASRGDSLLVVTASAAASSINLGGDAQIVITGDWFEQTFGPLSLPLAVGQPIGTLVRVELPSSADRITYAIKFQAKRDAGPLGMLKLKASVTSLSAVEYR